MSVARTHVKSESHAVTATGETWPSRRPTTTSQRQPTTSANIYQCCQHYHHHHHSVCGTDVSLARGWQKLPQQQLHKLTRHVAAEEDENLTTELLLVTTSTTTERT
ncbi:unnamed protein product [Ceratitis capitata]|uniref:(Mediterranean fruit fly) hypothetical protein n=1 Tax=Ceratitis capitata TaxID=7213 RepID=A0A811VBT5_CERCA|nr:unnamed protein product [Ceratitis capitata]